MKKFCKFIMIKYSIRKRTLIRIDMLRLAKSIRLAMSASERSGKLAASIKRVSFKIVNQELLLIVLISHLIWGLGQGIKRRLQIQI